MRKMIGITSPIRVGYSPFPTDFHCNLCNVSFTKRKFLKMHCDGLFHRDKVILSQSSTAGHQLPVDQNSELLFMPAQSDNSPCNRILYSETDPSGRHFASKSTVFSCDEDLERNDAVQEWTKMRKVSTNSKGGCRNISPTLRSASESLRDHEVQRNTISFVLFDHAHSSEFFSTRTGKRSHDEEFHDSVHLPLTETVSYPSRTGSAPNVTNEFDCKLCQRFTPDGSSQTDHLSSLEHCKLLLLRQHELGLSRFRTMYGDVPFLRILSASVPVPPPEFDANLTRIYRSAVVNKLCCRACGTEHEDLKSWFGHSLGESHSEKLYELLHRSDVYMFLSMFGDLPLPESMLPLLNESGGAEESNYFQMPRERSSLNQLKKNVKPLENLKVIDHKFASLGAPLKKRLHSSVDSSRDCDELADDSIPTTVSPTIKDNTFGNAVKVVDHNFESVPEVKGTHKHNLPSSTPTHLLESLCENLWLLDIASLSSHSASLLQYLSKRYLSQKSELQSSSEGNGSTSDQKTEGLHVESTGASDLPAVSEFQSLEQLNQIVEDVDRLSVSCTRNDEEINSSPCATSESVCQKGFGEVSSISVVISDPAKRQTSLSEIFMMSEDLTSVISAASFQVDLPGVDDALERIPVLSSSFCLPSKPWFGDGCAFEHLPSFTPQPTSHQLQVASNCEEIGVVISSCDNDQSENQINRSLDEFSEAALGLDGWSGSYPADAVVASNLKAIDGGSVDCSASSIASLVPHNGIPVASQSPVNREEALLGFKIPSHVTAINRQSKSNHGLDMTETNHKPVCFATIESTSIDIPALILIHPVCYSQAACSRTEDEFGTVTISVCASLCSTILPVAPKFPSSAFTLSMPLDIVAPMHSDATHRSVVRDVDDINCLANTASSASAAVDDLSTLTSAVNAVSSKLLEIPMSTSRTTELEAVVTSQLQVVCESNSSVHVAVPVSNHQSEKSSESASSLFHPSSNSLHPIHNAALLTIASEQDSPAARNADANISVACPVNPSISDALLLTDSATSRTPSASMSRSFGPAAVISKLSSAAPNITSFNSADDETLETMTCLGNSVPVIPSKSPDALSNVLLLAKSLAAVTHVSEGARIKLEPTCTSESAAINEKLIPTLECLPCVASNKSKHNFVSESAITTDVLSLSAAVSTAKTDNAECTDSLFSTTTIKVNFTEKTSFDCSEKAVVEHDSVSHDDSLAKAITPNSSLESKTDLKRTASAKSLVINSIAGTISPHAASTSNASSTLQFTTAITKHDSINSFHSTSKSEMKVPGSYLMNDKCLVKWSTLKPSTDVVSTTLQSIPHVIETIVKCEKDQSEPKTISLPSATTLAIYDAKHAVISTSIADALLKCTSGKHEVSVTTDVVKCTSQSASTVVKITPSAASLMDCVADGTLTQSGHRSPASILKGISQIVTCPATTVVQSTGAESTGKSTASRPKSKFSRFSASTAAIKDSNIKSSTSLIVTRVKNTAQNTSVRITHVLSVVKDNAAVLTTKSAISSTSETKTNSTASETSSKLDLAKVPKTSVISVPFTTIKCTSVTTKAVLSKPVITQSWSGNSSKTVTTSSVAPLLVIAKTTETTATIASVKSNNKPLRSVKTCVSNSKPCIGSLTVTADKTQPSISSAAVAKVAIVGTSKSTTSATALKSFKMISSRASVTAAINCHSVTTVTSKISTVSAQSKRSINSKTSETLTTSNRASLLVTVAAKITEATAGVASRTIHSSAVSKSTSVSTSSSSASRAVTSAATASAAVTLHNTTAPDSGGSTIRNDIVIKMEPEDSNDDAPSSLGKQSTASNSQTKESPVSAAEPAVFKKTDNPALSKILPLIPRSTANCKQPLHRIDKRNMTYNLALTSPKKRGWQSSYGPRSQQSFNSQSNYRWRTELEARGNLFATPLSGQGVCNNDWGRRNWSDSVTLQHTNSLYRQNCSPSPKKRRLMSPDDDFYNVDNFNNKQFSFIPTRKLKQFADCLEDVAIILQRNDRSYSMAENFVFGESLPWLERQKLDLLSKFTGIQDFRLLLSASQLLACLDMRLLERFAELQLLCSESSFVVRNMMMQLLKALDEGCRQNLF